MRSKTSPLWFRKTTKGQSQVHSIWFRRRRKPIQILHRQSEEGLPHVSILKEEEDNTVWKEEGINSQIKTCPHISNRSKRRVIRNRHFYWKISRLVIMSMSVSADFAWAVSWIEWEICYRDCESRVCNGIGLVRNSGGAHVGWITIWCDIKVPSIAVLYAAWECTFESYDISADLGVVCRRDWVGRNGWCEFYGSCWEVLVWCISRIVSARFCWTFSAFDSKWRWRINTISTVDLVRLIC